MLETLQVHIKRALAPHLGKPFKPAAAKADVLNALEGFLGSTPQPETLSEPVGGDATDLPVSFFQLSFCDPDRPQGQRHLGTTVVAAENPTAAILASHRLGINPGGEVEMVGVADDGTIDPEVLAFMLNKLRSRAEMEAKGVI